MKGRSEGVETDIVYFTKSWLSSKEGVLFLKQCSLNFLVLHQPRSNPPGIVKNLKNMALLHRLGLSGWGSFFCGCQIHFRFLILIIIFWFYVVGFIDIIQSQLKLSKLNYQLAHPLRKEWNHCKLLQRVWKDTTVNGMGAIFKEGSGGKYIRTC